MSEARENDLVSVLNEKDALIERLQNELKEAREALRIAASVVTVGNRESANIIRASAIEECAKVADKKAAEIKYIYDDRIAVATDIAKAIRSIDGGGKP